MSLPKVIVGSTSIKVERRKINVLNVMSKMLMRLRNATYGLYDTALEIGKMEHKQADLLTLKFANYKKILSEEFAAESELMKISAKTYNFASRFLTIGEEMSAELREGKVVNWNAYIQKLRILMEEYPILLDEYAKLKKIILDDKKYEKFFEKFGMEFENLIILNKKKLGALRQQGSQLSIAINTFGEISEFLNKFK